MPAFAFCKCAMRDVACSFSTETPNHICAGAGRAPVTVIDEFLQERTALGQHLIDVPVRPFHRVEHGGDMRFRNVLVKKIAHRIDEDHTGPLPLKRLGQPFGPEASGQSQSRTDAPAHRESALKIVPHSNCRSPR